MRISRFADEHHVSNHKAVALFAPTMKLNVDVFVEWKGPIA